MSDLVQHVRRNTFPPMIDLGFATAPAGNSLLSSLPSEDFDLLAPHLGKATYEQGSVLQEAGQPVTRAYFVDSGLVSLLTVMPEGHAIGTCAIGREGAVGLSASLNARKASTRAVVHIAGAATHIPLARLVEAASHSNPIRDMIVGYSDVLLEQTIATAACNAVHHVGERMCGWLLRAHERTGQDILPLTQDCLAGLLGVQRTTITFISRRLQAAGMIKVCRGRIQIRDPAGLRRKTCSCHSARA